MSEGAFLIRKKKKKEKKTFPRFRRIFRTRFFHRDGYLFEMIYETGYTDIE